MKLRRDVVDSMIRHDPELLSVWDAIVSDAVRQLVVLNVERWIHGEPPKRLSEVL